MITAGEATKRIRKKHGRKVLQKELPFYIRPYANFMAGSSKRPPSRREIVKAYVVTLSSIQRQATAYNQLCRYYPEFAPLRRSPKNQSTVRPEDAMSVLLFSKWGKKYLDAAERGRFDSNAARAMVERMGCYGKGPTLMSDLKNAVELGQRDGDVRAALKAPAPEWIEYVKREIKGISAAKAGFYASLLGRGDVPTYDARELDLWQKKRGREPDTQDVLVLKERIRNVRMKLDPEHAPFREHLVHHVLWDAYGTKPTKTTHGAIIRAMQFAGGPNKAGSPATKARGGRR